MTDPAQSIRVAEALAERYLSLSRGGTRTTSEVELAIGEAQQVYPEIWRHLDEARAALAQRGADVSGFDALRCGEGTGLGADVELTQNDYRSRLGHVYFSTYDKSATFNLGGAQRALSAAATLKAQMPEVDWAARAREQDRLIREAGSLKTAPWLALAKVGGALAAAGLVALLLYMFLWNASPVEERPAPAKHHLHVPEPVAGPAERRLGDPVEVTATRATCQKVRGSIIKRLTAANNLVDDPQFSMQCEGILIDGQPVALAVSIVARMKGDALVDLRGLVSTNGLKDLQPLTAAPVGTTLALVGDLDADGTDELVFLGLNKLIVSRVSKAGFTDIAGPTMPTGCGADATIGGDYRNGGKGEKRRVILTVPEGQTGKGCLSPGPHYYKLVADGLVED